MQPFKLLLAAAAVALAGLPALANDKNISPIVFHFYGAEDCGPCQAFKLNSLSIVESSAARSGYAVAVNFIARTQDIGVVGGYGLSDPLLRKAAPLLRHVYPPIFFVSRDGEVISAHGADWSEAMKRAERATKELQDTKASGN